MENTGSGGFINSKTILVQIFIGLSAGIILYLFNFAGESFMKYLNKFGKQKTVLLLDTYPSDGDSITIVQNPNLPNSNSIFMSDNERTGPEFSYSFFINVAQQNFTGDSGILRHVFHKGYPSQFPLLSPGVYMHSAENTMRIYMNSYKTWNNFVDIENIPIGKWVHMVITCSSSEMNVFVNGNLVKKFQFEGFQVYQNYQDICVFSNYNITNIREPQVPSLNGTQFTVKGHVQGLLSRLYYFNYCLSYTEINSLLNEGPSSKIVQRGSSRAVPPYLVDSWWTTPY